MIIKKEYSVERPLTAWSIDYIGPGYGSLLEYIIQLSHLQIVERQGGFVNRFKFGRTSGIRRYAMTISEPFIIGTLNNIMLSAVFVF